MNNVYYSCYKKQVDYTVTFIGLVISIYYFISCGLSHEISPYIKPHETITAIFNSNQLFLPSLYQDVFLHHGPFSEWTLSTVPFLFPDGLIFYIVALTFHTIQTAVLLSNAATLILYYLLMVSLGTYVCGESSKNLFRFSVLLCLSLGCNHLSDHEVMLPLWSSHFGSTILIYLLSLLLILTIVGANTANRKHIYIYGTSLGIIIFLTTLSDPFFFVVLPSAAFGGVLTLSLHRQISYQTASLLFFWVAISSLLGFLANSYDWLHLHIASFFDVNTSITPSSELIFQRLRALYHIFVLYYANNPSIVILSVGVIFLGIAYLSRLSELNWKAVFTIVCVTFTLIATFFSSIFIDKDLLRHNFLSLRHFQPSLLLPAFLCFPIFLTQSQFILKLAHQYYAFLVMLLIGCLILFQPVATPDTMLNFYPPLTQCLDDYAREGKLFNKNGISSYWNSHINDIFSKENLNIVAVSSGKPYNWMATKHAYQHKKFHFVLARKSIFSPKMVIHQWGKPDATLLCPHEDNFYIFLYNKGFYLDQ